MTLYALDGVEPVFETEEHWIAPTAVLIGRIVIADAVSVWWGSVLRGDNEAIRVGPGSNVQDNCVLHTDPGSPLDIAESVTIGHRVMLHGCQIGPGALIGIGATVLNGARVGARSILGAHALVPEGKTIPDGCLAVGVPARVVRELRPDELERGTRSAARYVDNARRYRQTLARKGGAGSTGAGRTPSSGRQM